MAEREPSPPNPGDPGARGEPIFSSLEEPIWPVSATQRRTTAYMALNLRARPESEYSLRGVSMLPALWPGDTVRLAPAERWPRLGEVVAVSRADGKVVCHRLLEVDAAAGMLRCKGDFLWRHDPWTPADQLVGVVGSRRRLGRERPTPPDPGLGDLSAALGRRAQRLDGRLPGRLIQALYALAFLLACCARRPRGRGTGGAAKGE